MKNGRKRKEDGEDRNESGTKGKRGGRETRWEGELRHRMEELSSKVERGMGARARKEKVEVVEIKRRVELQERRE